jgi:hypothetical protein
MSDSDLELTPGPETEIEADESRRSERGVSIVIGSLVLLTLMGMAGFAVDLGWLFLQQTNARKAAEAAALAGVVHMPLPSSITFAPGTEPWDVAVDIADRAGYVSTEVLPAEIPGEPNQLNVSIDTTIDTFFMRVFGINEVDIGASATAEQLPPLKIGSDEAYLGTDPTIPGRYRHFWVSINGEREIKENGDPFSTRCTFSSNCGPTSNSQFKDPAYYYAIEVPASHVGDNMTVEVYDGGHYQNGRSDFIGGNPLSTGDRVNMANFDLTFQLHAPDVTPGNPQDNPPIGGCGRTYVEQAANTDPTINEWTSICSVTATSGIYVLSVSIDGDDRAISDFAFRVAMDGNYDNDSAVFGLGAMSVDMIEAAVAPNFKLVRVDEVYAGQQLIISLFDPGDVSGGSADLSFQGSVAGLDCEYRVYNHDRTSLIQNWGPDDSSGAPCELDTSGQRFNNQWLEFRFDVPASYTCPGSCWMTVDYNFAVGASVSERTTWAATINGQPIHLID